MAQKRIDKAKKIMEGYDGPNPYLMSLPERYGDRERMFTEFNVDYIIDNHKYKPVDHNTVVEVSDEYALLLMQKHKETIPLKKIKIFRVVGEMGGCYHCYAQYRQSVPPRYLYIRKDEVMTQLMREKTRKKNINFAKYDKKATEMGRTLYNHQKDGVRFLVENRRCILADAMGMGKSATLTVSAMESGSKRILVVCPASLKTNWKKEISYYDDEKNIQIVKSDDWPKKLTKWTIINYDILGNFYELPLETVYNKQRVLSEDGGQIVDVPVMVKGKPKTKISRNRELVERTAMASPLYKGKFDCVIIDEAHKLSNNKSNRYRILSDFLKRTGPDYVFLTTGTPLVNKPINLYHVLKLLNTEITANYQQYVDRYCDPKQIRLKTGKTITLTNGASNLTELRDRLKYLYIRRLLENAVEMKEKRVSVRYYDLNDEQTQRYDELWGEYLKVQKEQGKYGMEAYKDLVEGMLVRQYLANEMIANTTEIADELLEGGEKVVIICTFQEEMDSFKEYYKEKAVMFNGTTTAKNKDKAVDEFMNNPKVTIFIGQVEAMVGITLTSARYLIFNSYSWISASNAQAEDRIYRISQDRDVQCVYQVFNDEISRHMFDVVKEKKMISDTVIQEGML
ncbi:MAG: DEAD/DEAH box helicase [Bacteroidales bacterium]|nr:DEAD/DEAH box helicase [Bacteroidales bacterium]